MNKFTISLRMCSEKRLFDEKTRNGFWMNELNSEWKIKCICEQNKLRNLAFMEIHRKSLVGENMISGTLEIHDEREQRCLLRKKFICLLEDGYLFTRIDVQCSHNAAKPSSKVLLMTGEITISARTESSMNLTELVHLINTDYSSLRKLSNDMESLHLEKFPFADVSLKCGSLSIPAHKSILSARSAVFKAMFSYPMKEAIENEVFIEDIEAPVLQAMVKYIYTGKIEDLTPSLASDLLFVANKYQIASLEYVCNKYLMDCMSIKNVANLLLIGDFISEDMKKFAIDFVCNKCTDYTALEKTKDWISLKNNKPALALEVFSAVVKSQEKKLKVLI